MARTYAYAIAGGVIATFTISPVLGRFFCCLAGNRRTETRVCWGALSTGRYLRLPELALANRLLDHLGGAGLLLGAALLASLALGMEFLPHLEEGNFWIRATMPRHHLARNRQHRYVNRMRRVIRQLPGGDHGCFGRNRPAR